MDRKIAGYCDRIRERDLWLSFGENNNDLRIRVNKRTIKEILRG